MDIYLSPHHDDVCFSLGAMALQRRHGMLVNIFTHSQYIDPIAAKQFDLTITATNISALRADEDILFAKKCNVTRFDFGFPDSSVTDEQPFYLNTIDGDVALVENKLINYVTNMITDDDKNRHALFCPMGIGGHRDHVAVLMSILNARSFLHKHFKILFYEDLHYASYPQLRSLGISRFKQLTKGLTLKRFVLPLSDEVMGNKLALVALYASQHAATPIAKDYTPCGWHSPHEALLEIE